MQLDRAGSAWWKILLRVGAALLVPITILCMIPEKSGFLEPRFRSKLTTAREQTVLMWSRWLSRSDTSDLNRFANYVAEQQTPSSFDPDYIVNAQVRGESVYLYFRPSSAGIDYDPTNGVMSDGAIIFCIETNRMDKTAYLVEPGNTRKTSVGAWSQEVSR